LADSVNSQPTVLETASRLWNSLPSLWKVLIPTLGALLIVLLPANLLITSRIYAVTTENLRAQHQALLADIGNAFDELIGRQTLYLATLDSGDKIRACAASGCASESASLFGPELAARLRETGVYYTEIGFIDASGKETARAVRAAGNMVATPGDIQPFSADPASLRRAGDGQVYVFPITRDPRNSAVEAYQQPILRLAMPLGGGSPGYVTIVLNLDDFFAQNFVYSDRQQVFLLDTDRCLLASSDDTQRAAIYKTWSGDPARVCYTGLPLEDWDTAVQRNGDTILSTRVIHGPLATSGQTWTLVVQQPAAIAYADANTLRTLLTGAHLATMVLVGVLIAGADRATTRLLNAARSRTISHARDSRFDPYFVGTPIEDRRSFFGRTEALARVIGSGVMGGDDVLIDGDPRIGKTSLLRQVERRLRERQVSDPNYWYWPIAFNLQGVPPRVFYRTLMDHVLRDIEDSAARTDLRYHMRGEGDYGAEDFREDIVQVLDLPAPDRRQRRIVLCLDNVHLWFNGTSGYDRQFIDTLRDVLTDVGNQLKLVAAGTHIPPDAFGYSATIITLGPLTTDEAERMIRQPVAEYYQQRPAADGSAADVTSRRPDHARTRCRIDCCPAS
jgi:AAA ATPase domain